MQSSHATIGDDLNALYDRVWQAWWSITPPDSDERETDRIARLDEASRPDALEAFHRTCRTRDIATIKRDNADLSEILDRVLDAILSDHGDDD